MNENPRLFTVKQPLVLAYGMGVDSTAIIVRFVQLGIVPDLILFANTKAEKPETYAYLPVVQKYLADHTFPEIQVVEVTRTSKHESLESECLTNETLPSLAFGMKSCSLKWKVGPQNKYCNNWQPAREAWACGVKVKKVIGYDASPRDACRGTFGQDGTGKGKCICCRTNPCKKYDYWYALLEWGIDRDGCKDIIRSAGLPVPPKSACFFCPASHKDEIIWLAETHPQLAKRALRMEDNFLTGRHPARSTKGLGRRYAWRDVLAEADLC
ncbi:MAG TPA: phosphoadenosine phosphosulfate reductase [Abditibacteriaceae bacterium]|jgi:hypothetical protein